MVTEKEERLYLATEKKIKEQFSIRSKEFDLSANWVRDENLIQAHVELAGDPRGEALDLCCGTGQIGRALKENGWNVKGLDITENMVRISSNYFPTFQGNAENIPFEPNRFHLIVCRQSFQFLRAKMVLPEIARALVPEGTFVLSLTVAFSDADRDWLYEIHRVKQAVLVKFYTAQSLIDELKQMGFSVKKTKSVTVRESINRWMEYAPELTQDVRGKVLSMVRNAPAAYRKLHRIEIINEEVFEDWNWIVLRASFSMI